jgi:predicted transcriptional regulator
MDYVVTPAPGDEFGISVTGENVQIVEDTIEPYWHFLLWLAVMQLLSVIDILLYHTKLIFTILGFRVTDRSNSVGILKRKSIYFFIKTFPGTCTSEIASNIGLSQGALRYHLNILEAESLIEAQYYCGKFRYFHKNSTYSKKEKLVISALQDEMTRKIISKILKEECSTNGDISRTTGVSKGTITWYTKQLKELDFIEENKVGRNIIYNINPAYRNTMEKIYMKFFE